MAEQKLSEFEEVALEYFRTKVPAGHVQRIDGIACFSSLSDYWFWHWRLKRMVKKGLLIRRETFSIWPSCNGLYAYGIASDKVS